MNIKITKKRARQIFQEEIKKFLQENKDVDPKILKEYVKNYINSNGEQNDS